MRERKIKESLDGGTPPAGLNPALLFRARTLVIPGVRPGTAQVLHDVAVRGGLARAARNIAKAERRPR